MGIKDTIQRWLGFLSLGVLGLGFLLLGLNALLAVIGWMGDSQKRFISLHIDSLGKAIMVGVFVLAFTFVYCFKSAEGFAIIKDQLLPVALPALLVLLAVSRLLSSGAAKAYGPLDGLGSLAVVLFMAWPLWADFKSRPPRPQPQPEPEPAAGDDPQVDDDVRWDAATPAPGYAPPDQTAPYPMAPPPFPVQPPPGGQAGSIPPAPPPPGT